MLRTHSLPAPPPSRAAEAWPWLAAAAGLTLVVAACHPGFMISDSISQLRQARTGEYSNLFPPTTAFVWRQLDRLVPGPLGMLLAQNLAFWSGLALVTRALLPAPSAALAVAAAGGLPPVFGWLGTVMIDVQMGSALLLASGLLLRARVHRSRALLAASLAPLAYATAIRHNAAFAMIPLALLTGMTARDLLWPHARAWRALAAGAACAALIAGTTSALNTRLTRHRHWPDAILLHDILAISIASGEDFIPDRVRSDTAGRLDHLVTLYDPYSADSLVWNAKPVPPGARTQREYRETVDAWAVAVRRHPWVYVKHRARMLLPLLGIGEQHPTWPFRWGDDWNDLVPPYMETALGRRVHAALVATERSPLFCGWPYVAIAVAAVALAWRRDAAIALFAASALAYIAPLFVIAPSATFRYLWWPVLVAVAIATRTAARALASARARWRGQPSMPAQQ